MRMLCAAALLMCAGCFHYQALRVSTLDGAELKKAQLTLPMPRDQAGTLVEGLFAARGFPVVTRLTVSPTVIYYIFKGARQQVSSIYGNADFVTMQSYNIGSWFVARLTSDGAATTVLLFGKPTINGTEVCSDADAILAEAQYWCRDTKILERSPFRPYVTGRDEREVVTGVLIALDEKLRTGR